MSRRVAAAAMLIPAAHLAWAARLVWGPSPLSIGGAGLVAAGMLLMGIVATIAVLLAPSPFSRRLGLATGVWQAVVAIVLTIDTGWIIGVALSTGFVWLLAPPPDGSWFVSLARPRVPPKATALAVGLIGFPIVVGATGFPDVTPVGYALAGTSVIIGWAYSRAFLTGLWAARTIWPALAIGAGIGLSWPAATGLAVAAGGLMWLAWSLDAHLAASPLSNRRTAVPILPELVPPEILESAGFDAQGRPKEPSGDPT